MYTVSSMRRVRLIQKLLNQQLINRPCGSQQLTCASGLRAHSVGDSGLPAASEPGFCFHNQGESSQHQQTLQRQQQQQQQRQHVYGQSSGDTSSIDAQLPAPSSIVLAPPAWSTASQTQNDHEPPSSNGTSGNSSSSSNIRLQRLQHSSLGGSPVLRVVGVGALNRLASRSHCNSLDPLPSSIQWLRHRHKSGSVHGMQTFSSSSSSSTSSSSCSSSSSSDCDMNLEPLAKHNAFPFGTANSSVPQSKLFPGELSTLDDGSCCGSVSTEGSSLPTSTLDLGDLAAASAAEPHTVLSIFRKKETSRPEGCFRVRANGHQAYTNTCTSARISSLLFCRLFLVKLTRNFRRNTQRRPTIPF
ncbi:hypothetical protein DUNSADRAFT_1574, partial [Dunaliella salina]